MLISKILVVNISEVNGKAIVTTGIPVESKQGEVSHKRVRKETYEDYITRQLRKKS